MCLRMYRKHLVLPKHNIGILALNTCWSHDWSYYTQEKHLFIEFVYKLYLIYVVDETLEIPNIYKISMSVVQFIYI